MTRRSVKMTSSPRLSEIELNSTLDRHRDTVSFLHELTHGYQISYAVRGNTYFLPWEGEVLQFLTDPSSHTLVKGRPTAVNLHLLDRFD